MRTPILDTERLVLREVRITDTDAIFDCWMSDNDVSRYMWWKASDDITETIKFVQREIDHVDDEKWYRWLIISKDSQNLVGTCLAYWNDEDQDAHWDISYNLGKKFWGNGYTTEAMETVLQFMHNELNVTECITSYAKVNYSSANVLHKLGFIDEREIPYECSKGEFITEGIICRKVF